jgi:hypothetical protein
MMTATNRLNQTAGLPGFSSLDANELERIDGGEKVICTGDITNGKGKLTCTGVTSGSTYVILVGAVQK